MLNTDIVNDAPDLFSQFVVDLSDIQTDTGVLAGKSVVIQMFVDLLGGVMEASDHIHRVIRPTINIQYRRGI